MKYPIKGHPGIGIVLWKLREESKLSQKQLAKITDISTKTIGNMERGDGNQGSLYTLFSLLNVYKVKPSEFFEEVEKLDV